MIVLRTRKALERWRVGRLSSERIGFVPTMGALHAGHLSLVKKARSQNDSVVASIFVNPTQFGPNEDFKKYPRTEAADLKLLKAARTDVVFIPRSPQEIYSRSGETKIVPRTSIADKLEGAFRPGHFEGVATVVFKLFALVKPQKAYFGEKDYQQLKVIEAMVEDLFLPVKIVSCETFREKSGLAMSSRNRYLDAEALRQAALFSQVLKTAKTPVEAKRKLKKAGFKVDYIAIDFGGRWLGAVRLGNVRLIDNVAR